MNEAPPDISGLPIGHTLWAEQPPDLAASLIGPYPPHHITILLVDDEPDLRSLLVRVLRREGYQIVDAADGLEALDLFAHLSHHPIHLLITDLDMPRLGGLDLARHLRETNRVQRVIFMTGDMNRVGPHAPEHHALLQKPFHPRLLAQVVNQILAQLQLTPPTGYTPPA
ncbi:PAS domain S-box protein [Oscillochloris trichoides DG-6]|uniref:PAS domain S-box protein n=1 Tax=Oscillochloris trichoides DG-6 TaxID=765420 RepID=E1ICA7_9CHLR|nr:response regulator [Oscillochloris trichoides]EFO81161.1 PAS domain S-box protein [Oscillochloris trichoides DG-6]